MFRIWRPKEGHYGDQKPLGSPLKSEPLSYPEFGKSIIQNLDCSIDREHLAAIQRRNGLEDRIRYLKRYIRFHRTPDLKRQSLSRTSQSFLPSEIRTIDIRKKQPDIQCDSPLEVDVTTSGTPSTVDASLFMFGVSTTYARLMNTET
jgi:hypothetical protein